MNSLSCDAFKELIPVTRPAQFDGGEVCTIALPKFWSILRRQRLSSEGKGLTLLCIQNGIGGHQVCGIVRGGAGRVGIRDGLRTGKCCRGPN
jgi:hypothetical protein